MKNHDAYLSIVSSALLHFKPQGLADCRFQQEFAIVRYEGAPEGDPTSPVDEIFPLESIVVNPWNEKASELNIPLVQLDSAGKFKREP